MIRVGLIFGGRSGEHEVSLRSAQSICNGFDNTVYQVVPIAIGKSGKWYGPIAQNEISSFNEHTTTAREVGFLPKPGRTLYDFSNFNPLCNLDVIFPIIHGTNGEDGTLQGLLEYLDIPYVGAGVCGSAVGMDKIIMKDICKANQIPQVAYLGLESRDYLENPENTLRRIQEELPFPVFVKPANLGSSVGISKAKNKEELHQAILLAAKYDRRIIVEEGRNVRELEVSALGNEEVRLSNYGEVIPGGEFYDYEAKYIKDTSVTKMAEDLDLEQITLLDFYSRKLYKALDIAGFTRIDFFLDKDSGEILFNEVNTLPGFTSISMYPKLWEEKGLELQDLLDVLVRLALERHELKSRLVREY